MNCGGGSPILRVVRTLFLLLYAAELLSCSLSCKVHVWTASAGHLGLLQQQAKTNSCGMCCIWHFSCFSVQSYMSLSINGRASNIECVWRCIRSLWVLAWSSVFQQMTCKRSYMFSAQLIVRVYRVPRYQQQAMFSESLLLSQNAMLCTYRTQLWLKRCCNQIVIQASFDDICHHCSLQNVAASTNYQGTKKRLYHPTLKLQMNMTRSKEILYQLSVYIQYLFLAPYA